MRCWPRAAMRGGWAVADYPAGSASATRRAMHATHRKDLTMTPLDQLTELGQAVWFDYIRRSFTRAGDLQALIDQGVRGVTSNPAIFESV